MSLSAPRITAAPFAYADALALEHELSLSRPLAELLVRRGLGDPAEARAWLAADTTHSVDTFAGLGDAASHLLDQVRGGARITVHGDYDVDGVCSTAILVSALRSLGANVDWFLPDRIADGYGLAEATVARLAQRGTTCLVCVDCAITAVTEVAAARAAGIDVVVCDHHAVRADGALPDAVLVHPGLAGYPCPDLCATAVAHKLVAALVTTAGADPAGADGDLDLVALATVCDVVPLRDENRRLVREGLRQLARTTRPGLRELMRVARVDPGALDARAIGFGLGPRLNAAGRIAHPDAALELLMTEDVERARAVAAELDALNGERRLIETRILFAAESQISAAGQRAAHVVAGEGWHRGVVGIVAGRLAERHHRPVAVIALDGDRGVGSARSVPGYDLLDGLHAAAPALTRYGGHRAAAGFELESARVDALAAALNAHAGAALTPEQLVGCVDVDAVVCGDELGLELAEELERLEPFGASNPSPTLLVAAATLSAPTAMGEGRHARFTVQAGGTRSSAVCFGHGIRLGVEPGAPVDAAVALERHRWGGTEVPRLLLRAARPCEPGPVRVLGEPDGYLQAALAGFGLAPRAALATGAEAPPTCTGGAGRDHPPAARLPQRTVCDRRGSGLAGILAAVVAGGEPVLVLCAEVQPRLRSFAGRLGGFALAAHAALEREPALSTGFMHVVALDPPAEPDEDRRMRASSGVESGFCHLAWGPAELRLARHVRQQEFDLRAPLGALYRGLRGAGGAGGERLEALLRGDGGRAGSAARARRMLAVLHELGLVRVDAAAATVELLSAPGRTPLETSRAFRASQHRLEEGLQFLSQATAQAA